MQVVILAGGSPSTISEGTTGIPKPMAEIGNQPILWHIMKHFASYGFQEFVICGGYKVEILKDYFKDYYIYQSDIMVDLQTNQVTILKGVSENWKVTVIDTGLHTGTEKRVSLAKEYIKEDTFLVTYGDCLSDVDLNRLMECHRRHGKKVTMMVANPTGRNAALEIDERDEYHGIKSQGSEIQSWVNACTYVMERSAFEYMIADGSLENGFLQLASAENQVTIYRHGGFWTPIETLRDKKNLETMWLEDAAPWKSWEE